MYAQQVTTEPQKCSAATHRTGLQHVFLDNAKDNPSGPDPALQGTEPPFGPDYADQ